MTVPKQKEYIVNFKSRRIFKLKEGVGNCSLPNSTKKPGKLDYNWKQQLAVVELVNEKKNNVTLRALSVGMAQRLHWNQPVKRLHNVR